MYARADKIVSAPSLRAASPSELKEQLDAERRGVPFLVYRDGDGRRRIVLLAGGVERLTIGRRESNDVSLPWDGKVSRVHAEVQRLGVDWTLSDDGLSRNGSYVNDERVNGRRRLRDGDLIRLGDTVLLYRAAVGQTDPTLVGLSAPAPPSLSPTQRKVLLALARPCKDVGILNAPASNLQIALELGYSVEAVKAHLRVLFHKFGVDHLRQNEKRLKLVDEALRTGAIARRDLDR
jgi:pSer/pThr/pTyr-binding forkhead associated (FHA) protein